MDIWVRSSVRSHDHAQEGHDHANRDDIDAKEVNVRSLPRIMTPPRR